MISLGDDQINQRKGIIKLSIRLNTLKILAEKESDQKLQELGGILLDTRANLSLQFIITSKMLIKLKEQQTSYLIK